MCSVSPCHSQRAWWVSSELWRTVCVRYVASTTTSASANAFSTSPRSKLRGSAVRSSRLTASSGSSTTSSSSHSTSIASPAPRACLAEGVCRGGRDGCARETRLILEPVRLARADSGAHARQREGRSEVDSPRSRMRVRRPQNRRVEHPRQLEVGCVARLAADTLVAVLARRGLADHGERPLGPLLERILLDDDPHLLEASLDPFLGADQSCHERIASSILGYVPQRQMFPAIACRISSRVGSGFAATRAAAETTWPGVQ